MIFLPCLRSFNNKCLRVILLEVEISLLTNIYVYIYHLHYSILNSTHELSYRFAFCSDWQTASCDSSVVTRNKASANISTCVSSLQQYSLTNSFNVGWFLRDTLIWKIILYLTEKRIVRGEYFYIRGYTLRITVINETKNKRKYILFKTAADGRKVPIIHLECF